MKECDSLYSWNQSVVDSVQDQGFFTFYFGLPEVCSRLAINAALVCSMKCVFSNSWVTCVVETFDNDKIFWQRSKYMWIWNRPSSFVRDADNYNFAYCVLPRVSVGLLYDAWRRCHIHSQGSVQQSWRCQVLWQRYKIFDFSLQHDDIIAK